MGWRGTAAVMVVCWAAACARGATDEPDGSIEDGSSSDVGSADVALDNTGCPQFDLTKDPKHCGSCTHACASTELCSNGACKAQCDTPLTQCASDAGAICSDLTSDKDHCGACAKACETGDAGGMAPGTQNPDPGIFDGGYDGGPGWSLGTATCVKSACGVECGDAMALCTDEICYDTKNHHDHCGDCNTACAATTEWCTTGHCCGVGTQYCGSSCVSLQSDVANCGSCGHACDGGGCSAGACVACVPATITGPVLTTNLSGWSNAGVRITALKNTTLTSFVVNNQGAADVIDLTTTTGTVLQTLALPASNTAYVANVSWALTAGTSYDLILEAGTAGANGRWVSYSSFPQGGTGLQVVSTVDKSQTLQSSYWFTFTNLVSCP